MTENIGTLFKANLERKNPAVIDLSDPLQPLIRSYAELNARADGVALALVAAGIAPGDTVGILSLNRVEFIESFFGIMRIGAVPVPVNIKLPSETVRYILTDAATKLNFVDEAAKTLVPRERINICFDDDYEVFIKPGAFDAVPVLGSDLCCMPYTSGTTGKPKGVYLTHEGQQWAANTLVKH
ncbi:MAG: AMP-dependent synthetase, partial [Rhodospirillaceae bacterium]|nr:AMP-dependent synthetase [Rhodospirillaceae bacterium]